MRVYVLLRQIDLGDRVEAIYFDETEAREKCAELNRTTLDVYCVEDHDVRGYRKFTR